MKKSESEKQFQKRIQNGELDPSVIVRTFAEKTGDPNLWRLTLHLERPELYPEYNISNQRER